MTDLLRTAPGVKILVTSRTRLNARGENLHPVAGMSIPDQETDDNALDYSAAQLFVQSARRLQPSFEPIADDLSHIAQICRLVSGMPLAILLAAAWTEMLSPAEIAGQIAAQSINFLETEWRDVPARQRSMRAVFDHSWRLLTGRQRELFRALSVFRGGFTREAAQEVVGASLHELKVLVDRSLLHPTIAGRYGMHELLRQYAAEKLERSPDGGAIVRDRHAAFFAAVLERWDSDLKGPRQQQAIEEMAADIENARAAWDWAAKQGQMARLDQAIDGLCRFYEWRGRHRDGEAACRMAAEKLTPSAASSEELRTLIRILAWQSVFTRALGRTEMASKLLRQSLGLLDSSALADQDNRAATAFVLQQLGEAARSSDRREAWRLLEQSLVLYRSLGDRWAMANLLNSLGRVAHELSRFDERKRLCEESLALRQALGDRRGIADSLLRLSHDSPEEAELAVREAIAIYREIGNRVGVTYGLFSLTHFLQVLGRFPEACLVLDETAVIYHDLGMRLRLGMSKHYLGWAKTNLGLYEEARSLYQAGLAVFREVGDQHGIGLAYLGLGSIALVEEVYAEAWRLLEKSAIIMQSIGERAEEGLALSNLARAARGLGRFSQAQGFTHENLRLAAEIRYLLTSLDAVSNAALLLADADEGEFAVELYALITRHPYFANSRYREDVIGKYIAAAAAALPPEVVTAAQERGRARDLDATVTELLAELET